MTLIMQFVDTDIDIITNKVAIIIPIVTLINTIIKPIVTLIKTIIILKSYF